MNSSKRVSWKSPGTMGVIVIALIVLYALGNLINLAVKTYNARPESIVLSSDSPVIKKLDEEHGDLLRDVGFVSMGWEERSGHVVYRKGDELIKLPLTSGMRHAYNVQSYRLDRPPMVDSEADLVRFDLEGQSARLNLFTFEESASRRHERMYQVLRGYVHLAVLEIQNERAMQERWSEVYHD